VHQPAYGELSERLGRIGGVRCGDPSDRTQAGGDHGGRRRRLQPHAGARRDGHVCAAAAASRRSRARKIDEHGGRLIKTTGDGFLAEFASATAAVRCAIDFQRDVVAREAGRSDGTRIRLRIGINVGDIIVDGDDVAGDGDGVNIAARLEQLAPPDGICISAYVREQIHDNLEISLEDLGEQKLKNSDTALS